MDSWTQYFAQVSMYNELFPTVQASFASERDESSRYGIWRDERIFPAYVAAASLLILALQTISALVSKDESVQDTPTTTASAGGAWNRLKSRIKSTGSVTIFLFKFIRLNLVAALLVLVGVSAVRSQGAWYHLAQIAILTYALVLAVANAFSRAIVGRVVSFHLSLVLFALLALYGYRDVWPLMTFTLRPADETEGGILWAKVAFLALAAFVEPILEPYPYIPVDPTDPFPIANAEQTTSILSFLLFSFLDPVIYQAYKVPHLGHDQLPPLCDYDTTRHLIKRSYPHLDPFSGAKKGSLFWGLVKVFRRSLIFQVIILLGLGGSVIMSPIGTNRLLNYLEHEGEDALVKPWVWILCIALGPMFFTILFQLYIFLSTGSLVRAEAIITSLVFDHALRIRLKAEIGDSEKNEKPTESSTPNSEAEGSPKPSSSPEHGSTDEEDSETLHSRTNTAASTATASTSATVVPPNAAAKGKGSDTKKEQDKSKPTDKKKKDNMLGKINNLVTSDLANITNGRDFLLLVLSAPLHASLGMWFLYVVLGWSSFVGLAVMIVLCPVPAWVASLMTGVQKQKMKATDARVQHVTEVMSVLRMIKLFGWEMRVRDNVTDKRAEELRWIWKRKMLQLANNVINHTVPLVHMVVTYAVFTLVQKRTLSASIVFSSMTAFNMIRNQLFRLFGMIPGMIQAKVSLDRVRDFLRDTELLDAYAEQAAQEIIVDASAAHENDIGFGKATFSWTSEPVDGTVTPSRQAFRLHIDQDLIFKKGVFNLIIGPTGSGKTSILMALLREMHYIPSGPESWVNLPRDGGVAYAAQESWVQSETIKENILFGAPYDEERYKKVIYQCGLTRDLSLFEAGDATEVGEKGLTLSGGQKARVTLARAVYSQAQIVLLDDVLAALDVHTSRWIVNKCFKGDLLRGRTVLLVTHNVAMATPVSQFIVSLGSDGRILSQGSIQEAIENDASLAEEIKHEEEAIELDETESDDVNKPQDTKDGKLVVAEEIAEGHVSWHAFKLLLSGLGGRWTGLFWFQYLFNLSLAEMFDVLEMWWLGWWATQYTLTDPAHVSIKYYLGVYCGIMVVVNLFYVYAQTVYTYGALRASRSIHYRLVCSLLGCTFRWLDITPTSRVIARCTQDIQSVDGPIAQYFSGLCELSISMAARLLSVMLYAPSFAIPAIAVAALGGWLGNVYMKAQLSVKREMSNAKSPLLAMFGGAIAGLTSIRAYSAQAAFQKETSVRLERYVRACRTFYNLNRWISIRIDALSALFAASLAFYLVYGGASYNPSNIGFMLTMAVSFSEMILFWVRIYNEFEVSGNSLERIQQYITIEQEPEPKSGGQPPAYWPASGELNVEKLSARYSPDGPKVLEDVSFNIKAGERVGIVGRTGSGKSTLTLSLLRCILTEGKVVYDGIPTDSLNLDALRSNITIIPQVPELLSGTLRQNLDMFNQYDDAVLNDALRAAGLFSLQRLSDENRLTLDTAIASGGGNLSVGQRQIIALARAIVRQSKLLILDEATSAIDYETDSVIQSSLRTELKGDVTVITVAHRLQTIMDYDKIMVLDAGHLIEFDTPKALLAKEGSLLRALVEESADKEALYAMAEGKTVLP